ncbi:MAG: T9SS type A sorting domain-containing protein [Calditrichaeota bacterium]|nr:T9SS type A sorting domain-containing protein [Calditrichota bacterium]
MMLSRVHDAARWFAAAVCLLAATQAMASANRLFVGSGAGLPGSTGNVIAIALRNEAPVRGLQLELADLPDYLRPDSVWVTGRAYGFIARFNDIDGVLRLIAVSFNYTLEADSGAVVNVSYRVAADAPLGTEVALQVLSLILINGENEVVEATAEGGVFVVGFPSGVATNAPAPTCFTLAQNYPNPFGFGPVAHGTTSILFSLPKAEEVSLVIYDLLGREVCTLFRGRLGSGDHALTWDGSDAAGRPLPAGLYLYRLQAGERAITRRLAIVR